MAYGLIRVKELQAKEIKATEIHNARKFEENGMARPAHIRTGQGLYESHISGKLEDAINERINKTGVKVRSDSVVALEFVVSASTDFFDVYSVTGYFSKCKQWLSERYGSYNNIAMYLHEDETTPHAHFIVVPIVRKEVKWKNQKGEGIKTENRLCARDLTGNKKLLEQLQDDFYKFCDKSFSGYCKFYRGTKAAEQKKEYTKETNAELGQIRARLRELDKSIELVKTKLKNGILEAERAIVILKEAETKLKELEAKKDKIQNDMSQNIDKLQNKIEKHDKKNTNGGWKQGRDFTPGF